MGRGLVFEAREEAGECESGLLDLWVLIKGQDLFGMGSLLSAESTAAPGETAFLRDGWLSYVNIWQRGMEAVNILIGQDRFIVSFISKSLKKKTSLHPGISKMEKCKNHLSSSLVLHRRKPGHSKQTRPQLPTVVFLT